MELRLRAGKTEGLGEFGAFTPFWGESGRGEALSGSFLGREGPQKSTPYPGFKLEFKKHTSNPKIQLRCNKQDLYLGNWNSTCFEGDETCIDQDEATTLPPGCFFDGKIITEPTKLTVNIYKTPRHVLFDVDLSSDEGSLSDSFDLEECKDSQEYDSAPVSEYG